MIDERDEAEHTQASSGVPYVLALIGLLALTGLSFGLHYVPLGSLGALIALSIASAKIVIVGAVFMELRESMAATRMIALVSVAFVALLCLGIAGDVAFR